MDEQITNNVGEWSEFYAFLKILADQKLIPADEELNPEMDKALPVLKVFREEKEGEVKVYDISAEPNNILIYLPNIEEPTTVSVSKVSSKLSTIFSKISSGILVDEDRNDLMKTLKCSVFRAMPAHSKEDITMIIHDPTTGQSPKRSYSIKSQAGSPSTLLNASNATNFIYEINPGDFDIAYLNEAGSAPNIVDLLREIGGNLHFIGLNNNVFKQNMELIDYLFPEIMAFLLLKHYSTRVAKIVDMFNTIGDSFVLPFSGREIRKADAIYKVKTFLVSAALGMTPSHEWDGTFSANGGYLIVKTDGSVVCYHLLNIDSFKDYLFKTTRFERGSETKHNYGKLYKENDRIFIKLNLQIRFTT